MTTTRDDLMQAVLAGTDDDDRLVYADWLEQQGDPVRAQVIHLQCEAAGLGRWDRRRIELQWELDVVLAELGDRWRAELPVLAGIEWLALEKGFASAIRARDPAALYRHADAIRAAAPVERVELEQLDPAEDYLVTPLPWLRVLRVLATNTRDLDPILSQPPELEVAVPSFNSLDWLAQRRDDAPLARLAVIDNTTAGRAFAEELAAAPWAGELAALELATRFTDTDDDGYAEDPRLGAEGATALTALKSLRSLVIDGQRIRAVALGKLVAGLLELRELSARDCDCGKLAAFGKAKGAPLERLDLGKNALGTAGAQVLAAAPRLAELQRLDLDTCEIESFGLGAIVRSPFWQHLRWLDLSRNPIGASGVRMLVDAPRPAQLHTLKLADADLDDTAGHALGKIAWLGELAVLDLTGNMLGRGGISLRAIAPDALRELRLGSCGLERAEAVALARFWPRLVTLVLDGNAITDAGLERFATMKEAAALQTLRLRDCKLGADGIELLAQRARAPRLRHLALSANPIGAQVLEQLLRSRFVQRLESLELAGCGLDRVAIALVAALPLPPRLARLDLRDNVLDERMLLALADSKSLRAVPEILLAGNPWTFPQATREQLAGRFGESWYQSDD